MRRHVPADSTFSGGQRDVLSIFGPVDLRVERNTVARGRQGVRTVHFVIAWAIVLFVLVHVFEVIISGFWNNLRSMITGHYEVRTKPHDNPR